MIKLLLSANCIFVFSFLYAQQNKPYADVSIASPTAASLGKYADIPVDNFTGIPRIEVPFYTVKEGTLSLPISLSYHAGGLKVWEPAGWVGMNWALNAGGVITRSVVGGPDEKNTNNGQTEAKGYFSDSGYYSYLYLTGAQGTNEDWDAFAKGQKDGEPDLFFFNFNGYSGKFYFNDDYTPVLVPESDLKISCTYPPSQTKSISDFTITTPDGTKYFFGMTAATNDTDAVEMTGSFTLSGGFSSPQIISSWYLNKIESADGQFRINLFYTPENYGFFTIATFPVNPNENGSVIYGGASQYGYSLVKNIVQGVRLNRVTTSSNNVSVNFAANNIRDDLSDNSATVPFGSTNEMANNASMTNPAKSLDQITITESAKCKKFKFSYGYFVDNTTPLYGEFSSTNYKLSSDRKRLRLDSIQEYSCDETIAIPPYRFSYNTAVTVPRRICFNVDHWGFYNYKGNNVNNGLIPTYYVDGAKMMDGADRDANGTASMTGLLQKIVYPTGGFTALAYDSNQVYNAKDTTKDMLLLYTDLNNSQYGQAHNYSSYADYTVVGNNNVFINIKNYSDWSLVFKILKNGTTTASIVVGTPTTTGGYNEYNWFLPTTYRSLNDGGYAPEGDLRDTFYFRTYNPNDVVTGKAHLESSQVQVTTVLKNITVGGARVRSITTNDGMTTQNMVTTYDYMSGAQSTGFLYSRPAYVQSIRNDIIENVGYYSLSDNQYHTYALSPQGCPQSAGGGAGVYYKSAGSIRPMANAQGSHVGYRQVIVTQTGNGYSVYNYQSPERYNQRIYENIYTCTVSTAVCDDKKIPNYPAAPLPFEFTKGDLQYEAVSSETLGLLKEVYYKNDYTTSTIGTPGFIVSSLQSAGLVQYLGTRYVLKSAKKTHSQTIKIEYPAGYANGGRIVDTTDIYYGSPYHHESTKLTDKQSTGDVFETQTKSAFEYVPASVSAVKDGYPQYITDSSACQSSYGSNYKSYMTCMTSARRKYIFTQRNNFYKTGNAYITAHNNAENGADAILKPVLEMQDEYKNPVLEASTFKNGNLISASFNQFGYGTTGQPIPPLTYSSFVYPAKQQVLLPTSFASTFTASAVNAGGTSIAKDSRYGDEEFYSFNNGNPASKTGKDGVQQAYTWDYNNTLPVAKTVNAAASDVAYTSFETAATGNWTISGGSVSTASAITGGKSYTMGTSISRSGLNTSRTYLVSYWSKGYPLTISSTTAISGLVKNGWTYYQHALPANASSVTLTGNGTILDELRLYPADAQMNTYTYEPLVGITSQCDAANHISYYEYDALGRLARIRDIDKNILKQYCYTFNGKTTPCNVAPCTSASSSYYNNVTSSYTVTMTNTATGSVFSFAIPAALATGVTNQPTDPSSGTKTGIASGIYNIVIAPPAGYQPNANFSINSIYYSGNTCSLYNVRVVCPDTLSIQIEGDGSSPF